MKKINISALCQMIIIAFPLLLTACVSTPKEITQPISAEVSAQQEHQAAETDEKLPTLSSAKEEPAYPKIELSSQMLYTFLLADIAAQRGQSDLAAQAYLDIAKNTRDIRAVRRAAQLAYEAHQIEETLEAFRLWLELEPQSTTAKRLLATVLVGSGQLDEAVPLLSALLADDSHNAGRHFIQLYPLFSQHFDRPASYRTLKLLALPYPQSAEVRWVLAQAAKAASQQEDALNEVRQSRKLQPDWEPAASFEVQLLGATAPSEALSIAQKFLSQHPEANELRLVYARILLEQKQYLESRNQFQRLLTARPDSAEMAFAIALLSIQLGELDRAEMELKQTLKVGRKDSATVHYYLGQLNEAKKTDADALREYQQVKSGEYVFPSRLRIAYLMIKANNLKEAREILHKTESKNNQQLALLILTEGQILRDAKQYGSAAQVLAKGLDKLPDHPDLLYESAMVADKQRKHDFVEKLLRRLIAVAPSHAHAYNALGYAFLERKVNLAEAMQLVEKAHQLAPEDPAILDSLGWGLYMTDNLVKSVEFLSKAYAAYPDSEIAAHLGEVLWQQGKRDEARSIWQNNLLKNPDSAALKAVIKKFLP
jgi:tetratricopeptide (TPR) repeat protein